MGNFCAAGRRRDHISTYYCQLDGSDDPLISATRRLIGEVVVFAQPGRGEVRIEVKDTLAELIQPGARGCPTRQGGD